MGIRSDWLCTVADPEFYNGGGRSRGGGSPEKKLNFYLKKVDFGAFYDYFLRLFKNWSGQWGAAAPPLPLNPPRAVHDPVSLNTITYREIFNCRACELCGNGAELADNRMSGGSGAEQSSERELQSRCER